MTQDVALTRLQQELLRLFFGLQESKSFVLACGAGLVAEHYIGSIDETD